MIDADGTASTGHVQGRLGQAAPGGSSLARVVVLLGAPLTDHHFERLGIAQLATLSEVTIVDCMRLIGRTPDHVTLHKVDWPNYVAVETPDELHGTLRQCAPHYAFDDIGFGPDTAFVGEIAREHGAKLVCVREGKLPTPSLGDRLRRLISRAPSAVESKSRAEPTSAQDPAASRGWRGSAVHRIVARLHYEYLLRTKVPSPDVALLAGSRSLDWYSSRARDRLWIGSGDYHRFQQIARDVNRRTSLSRRGKYAVFVDVCLPLAADWKLTNTRPPIGVEEYYPLLRALLARVEQLLGMPVIIAGHPNSRSVPNYVSLLGDRELVFGQTAALVIESALVLSHASTATSFVALAAKPALFLSSKSIDQTSYGAFVRSMARSLDSPVVMLEQIDALSADMLAAPANTGASRRYVERYLRAPAAKESMPWRAFNDFIRERHGHLGDHEAARPFAGQAEN